MIFSYFQILIPVAILQYTITQVDIGCDKNNQNPCWSLCVLGVEDCSKFIPKCEYGYFLFTLGSSDNIPPKCVQCPYQSVDEDLTKYCMDCVEDPYGWELNRKCTYDYVVGNGITGKGTYQKKIRDYPELYFVGDAIQQGTWKKKPDRSTTYDYAVYICTGCSDFCQNQNIDSACHVIDHDYKSVDIDKKAVKCVDGYYFDQNLCQSCTFKYCLECNSQTCIQCQEGYRINWNQKSCIQCDSSCLTCHLQGEEEICDSCSSGYIRNLDLKSCESCSDGCLRCEYTSFSENIATKYPTRSNTAIDSDLQSQYIKYCRQCEQATDQFDLDGQNCYPCSILNCDLCYYQIVNAAGQTRTTMDLDFAPLNYNIDQRFSYLCFKCSQGYTLSTDKSACDSIDNTQKIQNCQLHKKDGASNRCILCISGIIFDQALGTCHGECKTYLDNCLYCMSYNSVDEFKYYDDKGNLLLGDAELKYQCLQCQSGFYPDFFTGFCIECQSNCDTCSQYNQNYNFTDYIQQQKIESQETKLSYLTSDLEKPYCSYCKIGYQKYGNTCQGCTSDCVAKGENIIPNDITTVIINECNYVSNGSFCGKCFNYFKDRSLNTDQSECHTCPSQCLACRDRTDSEIRRVNYYYNPSSALLTKYSRLCYSYDSKVPTGQAVTYDSYLNMPVQCKYLNGQTAKCTYTVDINIKLYCDSIQYEIDKKKATPNQQAYMFDLAEFYKQQTGSITNVTFSSIETIQFYELLNQMSVSTINLFINLVNEFQMCLFDSDTNIIVNLQKNVFSLKELKIYLTGEPDISKPPYNLFLDGVLRIPEAYHLIIQGINIQSQKFRTKFGLEITNNILTQLELINFSIGRDINPQWVMLVFHLDNINIMKWTQVTFQNLKKEDTFSIDYSQDYINSIDYTFNQVTIFQSVFYDTILFNPTQNPNVKTIHLQITDLGLIIEKCQFVNSSVFSELESNTQTSGRSDFSKVVLKFSQFNSSCFLYFKSQQYTSMSYIDIIKCFFSESSAFAISNSFLINKLFSSQNLFYNNSRLFENSYKVIDDPSANYAIGQFWFANMKIISSSCFSIVCLMKISTPINIYGYSTNITIENLLISKSDSFTISDKDSNSILSSLLLISVVQKVQVINFQSLDNFGITSLAAYNIESFNLDQGVYDWTQPQYEDSILQPANNKIPTSKDCALRKTEYKSFNEQYLYIADFDIGVSISNIVMRNLLSLDTNFIKIQSWDIEKYNSTKDKSIAENNVFYQGQISEIIILSNIEVIGNSLVITESKSQVGSIFIESNQDQTIKIENCKFYDNHLHSLSIDQLAQSSPIFIIISPLSVLLLQNNVFDNNRATQITNGVIYIISYNLTVINCSFTNTNIRAKKWVYRLEEQQIVNSTSKQEDEISILKALEAFFPILNQGGNLYAKSAYITIQDCIFNNSQAIQGAGVYLETIDVGEILIISTVFSNQYNSLLNQYQSKGGCLYIDSSNSQVNLQISEVTMNNCVTRQQGGCIFLSPSTQLSSISIISSKFSQCQGLIQPGISFTFSTFSQVLPEVFITNCTFSDNNIANYLRNIPDLSSVDHDYLTSTSSFYYQFYGILSLDSTIFEQFRFISILKLEFMVEVNFNNIQITNNTIFISPIIVISLSDQPGIISISASKFEQHQQSTTLSMAPRSDQCSNVYDTSAVLQEQTCELIKLRDQYYRTDVLLAKFIYNATDFPLYDINIEIEYNRMTRDQKYSILYPDFNGIVVVISLDVISLNLQFIIFQTFSDIENQKFLSCFFTILYNNYAASNSKFYSAIISIAQIASNQYLNIDSVVIADNQCLRCTNGLVQIYQIDRNSHSAITIIDFNCISNIIGYYGCLALTYETDLSEIISSLPLTDNQVAGRLLSVSDDLINQNNALIISECKFMHNYAKVGAGLTIIGLQTALVSSLFSDNHASLIGGGIYYQSSTYEDIAMVLLTSANIFEGNTAQLAGAMFISGGSLTDISVSEIIFNNNEGQIRGDNLEEYPQKLTLLMRNNELMKIATYETYDGDKDNDGFIDSKSSEIIDIVQLDSYQLYNYIQTVNYLLLPSGQPINTYNYYFQETNEQVPYQWKFRIISLDRFKQPMSNIQKTESCTISGRMMDSDNYNDTKEFLSNFSEISTFYYDQEIGAFNLDSLSIVFDPYLESNLFLQLRFICTSIQIPVYNTISPYEIKDYNNNYALYVNVKTLPCQLGEAYTLQKCKACTKADKTYSVNQAQTQCQVMDTSTMDDVNPTNVKLKAQYWRPQFDSSAILYCLNLPANCNGGWTPGNPSCYSGHMGALCESCDIYGIRDQAYAISAKYKCGQCADTVSLNAIVITALSLVTLISMLLSVKGNYQMLEDFIKQQNLKQMGILVSTSQSNLAILIKLFTNYFQILSSISTFQINLSQGITNATEVLGNPTQSMIYSLDCFLVSITTIEILYFRIIWALIMPMIYLTIFLFGYSLAIFLKQVLYKSGIIYTAFIYMFLYLQPNLVGGFISLASSRTIGGYPWVQADVMYRYDADQQLLWREAFVLPLTLIWALIFPCLFMYLVYKIRDNLYNFDNRKKLGYFYNEYRKGGYLWEFVKIFEKELIIIFLTFYEDRVVVKGLIIFLIVFFYGGFTVKYHPYSSTRLNFIDRISTAICAASLCLGVLIYASILEGLVYLEIIMLIIVAVLNIAFILTMVYYLFEGYMIKFQPQLDLIRDKVRIRYPELQQAFPFCKKLLQNKQKMNERVKYFWAVLRYETRQGIKRKRLDPNAPLFIVKQSTDQPILMPFFIEDSINTKQIQNYPNIQKINPELQENEFGDIPVEEHFEKQQVRQ